MGLDIYAYIVESNISLPQNKNDNFYSKPLDIAKSNFSLRKFIKVLSLIDDIDIKDVVEIEKEYGKESYFIELLNSSLNEQLAKYNIVLSHDDTKNFSKMFRLYSRFDSLFENNKENIFFNIHNEIYIARKNYELKEFLVELAQYYLGDDLTAIDINGLPILYKADEEKLKEALSELSPYSNLSFLNNINENQTIAIEINF